MTSLKEIMAVVPSPSEMGKAEKLYQKIGDFVLQEDEVDEITNEEDGSIDSITLAYSIPLDVWESRTGMKFEFKEGDEVYTTDHQSNTFEKIFQSLYVSGKLWKHFKRNISFKLPNIIATFQIEKNKNIDFFSMFWMNKDKSIDIQFRYSVDEDAIERPTKTEIYTRINESIYGLKRLLYPEEEKYAEPAAYAAPAPDVPVYVFFGHGGELPLKFGNPELSDKNTRSRLPDGITLVTISECNTTVGLEFEKIKPFEGIGEEKDISIFRDPIKNRESIRKLLGFSELNVYKTGDEYPALLYYPVSSHTGEQTKDPITKNVDSRTTRYRQSGVHKAPITLQTFNTEWIKTLDNRYVHKYTGIERKNTGDEIYSTAQKNFSKDRGDLDEISSVVRQKIFKDAVWPPNWDTLPRSVLKIPTPIEEVFKALGPGVYYWLICRGSSRYNPDAELVRAIRSESRSRHVTRGYGRKRKTYRRKTKKRLLAKR